MDETGRYDFWSRFLLHHSPFLFFLGGKRKGEWSNKNRDQKLYLPVSSSKWNIVGEYEFEIYIFKSDYFCTPEI